MSANKMKAMALALGMGLAAQASAGDADPQSAGGPVYALSGFGTVGEVHSSNNQADFVSSVFRPNGAGETGAWSAAVDTKLGLQLTATFNDQWSAVVQVISQQRYNDSWEPTVEWANVSWQATPNLRVRAGRVVWPLFTRSDTDNVGFSNFGIRPSAELAAEMPNTNSDGVNVDYSVEFGQAKATTTLLDGQSKVNYAVGLLTVKDIHGLSEVVEYGDWTVHAAYMKMKYIFDYPGGSPEPVDLPMYSLGTVYDSASWFLQADGLLAPDPYYGKMEALSALAGRHFLNGKVSPYAIYSQFKQATLGPAAIPLNQPTQATESVGVRWDFRKNFDVKLQLDHVKSGDVSTEFPISYIFPNGVSPQFLAKPNTNVVGVAVDFIF